MSAMRRFAFVMGFVLGFAAFVLIVGNVLLYLLTGKLPSIETGGDGRLSFGLVAPQEVVAMIKEQIEKERERYVSPRPEGGESS